MPRKSQHPGVRLFSRRRASGITHYARWCDPISGLQRDTNLTKLGLTNSQQRRVWARSKSDSLLEVKARVSAGGPVSEESIEDAVEAYLEAKAATLRKDTLRSYREALEGLRDWLRDNGVARLQDVSRATLFHWRADLAAKKPSASTANSHLRRVKVAANWWRRAGQLPRLDATAIRDALEGLRADRPTPTPLRREEIAELVEAAAVEREDLDVVLLYLLAGLRASEGLRLPWSAVRPTELLIGADVTKTRVGRVVELDVSPSLVGMLDRRPRVSGRVLDSWTTTSLRNARARLVARGAPPFTWQRLRQTCSTYLTNAPGIYGGASAFKSARRLGHSAEVAQRHYAGLVRVRSSASTLEEAMGIDQIEAVKTLHSKGKSAVIASM